MSLKNDISEAPQNLELLKSAYDSGHVNPYWIVENLPHGLFSLTVHENALICNHINQKFSAIFHKDKEDVLEQCIIDNRNFPSNTLITQKCQEAIKNKAPVVFEWQFHTPPNEHFLMCYLVPELRNDEVVNIVGVINDKTSEKRAERNLLHNALHDPLTNLPNRSMLQDQVSDFLAKKNEINADNQCAVIVINVDRFQHINETLGHLAGDEFLITFALRIKKIMRSEILLARINGDEFSIFIPNLKSEDDAKRVAERIHDAMAAAFTIGQTEFFATVSIGMATTYDSKPYAEEIIRDADFAMHRAKKRGRGQTELYARDHHRRAQNQFQLEIELRKAVQNGDLELHYQPIVSLETGKLLGFESLCRWRHRDRGLVPPSDFISLAEESGIIIELGRWALLEACEQMKEWQSRLPSSQDLYVTVNVSGIQFAKVDMAHETAVALARTGLSGKSLCIELTESTLMDQPEKTTQILEQLKELDVKLALDDFGTGYSSLSYLQTFPLDIIKVDRSFVGDIEYNDSNKTIVEIISMLSHTMGFKIVAEGLEKHEHIGILKSLDCHMGQGYYFAKPVEPTEAENLIKQNKKWLD